MKNEKIGMRLRNISCFGDRIRITSNFMNVINGVTFLCVLSYRYVFQNFLAMPVCFNFNLTYGLKPQFGGTKIATVYGRSIFYVEWLIATLIYLPKLFIFP